MNAAICPVSDLNERAGQYQLTAFSAAQALANEALVEDWRKLLGTGRIRYTMYMSPEWIGHIAERNGTCILIWVARDSCNRLVGVVPVARRDLRLTYDVANRVLWTTKLRVAEVLGSQPCLPDSRELLARLFEEILDTWPDCDGIHFDALPTDCFCSLAVRGREVPVPGLVYSPYDKRPSIVVPIGESFDEYMRTKSAKTRSKLRKLRTFIQSGTMRIERYSQASDVAEFAEGVGRVSARTWQNRLLGLQYRNDEDTRESFRSLANRGLLRSYLLWRGEQPLAYVIGYQYEGVYYYAHIGFDPQAAEFSPGTVLLFMILQDLHSYAPPALLNFGVGDAAYKQRFGKTVGSDETILLLRPGMRNRLIVYSHRGFMTALNGVKRVIGRQVQSNACK